MNGAVSGSISELFVYMYPESNEVQFSDMNKDTSVSDVNSSGNYKDLASSRKQNRIANYKESKALR